MTQRSRPVVLMVHDYPPFSGGGLALGVRQIVAALDDEFAFRVVSSRAHDHFADDRARLATPEAVREHVATLAAPRQALRWLREADAVVVHWTFSFRRLSTLLLLAAPLLGKPTVLVLLNGSALAVNWAQEHVPAIVEAWYPGQAGGSAIADVLFGD